MADIFFINTLKYVIPFFKKIFFFCTCLLMACCHHALADGTNIYRASIGDYCEFLNSTAATDPHNLYDPKMSIDPPMIVRYGHPGAYKYNVSKNAYPGNPITYVNKMSQARFCNWKENNQNGEQSSNTETGVYDLTKMSGGIDGIAFSFSATPNTTYSLIANNNAQGVSDPMLESATTYLMLNHSENSLSPNDNHASLSGDGVVLEAVSLHSDNSADMTDRNNSSYPQSVESSVNPADFLTPLSSASCDPTPQKNPNPIKISLVTIGDPGNQSDRLLLTVSNNQLPDYQFVEEVDIGSVATVFQIGKYDIQAKEYCAYLNAVASIDDRYAVYDTNMASDSNIACIIRVGDTNPYSYHVITGRENFPITYISYLRAVRFCNWIENGQPIGLEGPGTTETGSFNIVGMTSSVVNPTNAYNRDITGRIVGTNYITHITFNVTSNTNALWSIPTEDQWFKAAYYKPNTVGLDGFVNNDALYYYYGTSSDELPSNNIETTQWSCTNSANYCLDSNYTMASPPYVTPVGTFNKTKSPFGLCDMSGNVDQWIFNRSVRGGSWQSKISSAFPSNGGLGTTGEIGALSGRRPMDPSIHTNTIGFRLVYNAPSPPEGWGQFAENVPIRLGMRFWDCLKQTGSGFGPDLRQDIANASMNLYPWVWGIAYPELGKAALLKVLNRFRRVPTASELAKLRNTATIKNETKATLEKLLEDAKKTKQSELDEQVRLKELKSLTRGCRGRGNIKSIRKLVSSNGEVVDREVTELPDLDKYKQELENKLSRQSGVVDKATASEATYSESLDVATQEAAEATGNLTEAEEALEASVVFPPPLDLIIPAGIVIGGLSLAYCQNNVNGAMTSFGIALDGAGFWNAAKAFLWGAAKSVF